jgi:hypothetical protein
MCICISCRDSISRSVTSQQETIPQDYICTPRQSNFYVSLFPSSSPFIEIMFFGKILSCQMEMSKCRTK